MAQMPAKGPAILLYHCPEPDIIDAKYAPRIDLMVAGHIHGGQVALPLYGALATLSRFGKQFEQGFYADAQGLPLYVSRGIGMEGGDMPRVRFAARPELAVIELVR